MWFSQKEVVRRKDYATGSGELESIFLVEHQSSLAQCNSHTRYPAFEGICKTILKCWHNLIINEKANQRKLVAEGVDRSCRVASSAPFNIVVNGIDHKVGCSVSAGRGHTPRVPILRLIHGMVPTQPTDKYNVNCFGTRTPVPANNRNSSQVPCTPSARERERESSN